jgi:hypothetical protein
VAFLMKYFRQEHRLAPFGYFCIAMGAVSLVILIMR